MITKLGIIAGEILQLLEGNSEILLSELKLKLDMKEDVVLMSIGWLAREGHIIVAQVENDYRIQVRKK